MAHETPTIIAKPRERTGTRFSQRLRKTGRLPAVIYGHKADPVSVSIDEKEIINYIRNGSHVFNVSIEGGKTETCLIKDLQFGFLGDNVIHMDFARVNLDEEVHVNVRMNFVGTCPVAAQTGAIITYPMTELEVVCKVNAIPEELRIDTSKTKGNVMTIGDIELPPGIRTELAPGTPVMTINFIHEEEAVGEEVEVSTGDSSEPEVITEAKDDEKETKSKS